MTAIYHDLQSWDGSYDDQSSWDEGTVALGSVTIGIAGHVAVAGSLTSGAVVYKDALTWNGTASTPETWGMSTVLNLGSVTLLVRGYTALAATIALLDTGASPVSLDSPVSMGLGGHVGLSGALGFTLPPDTVFLGALSLALSGHVGLAATLSKITPFPLGAVTLPLQGHAGLVATDLVFSDVPPLDLGSTGVALRGRVGLSFDAGLQGLRFIGGSVFLEESIFAALRGLVNDRVYPDTAPDKTVTPYITYQQVGGISVNFMEGTIPNKKRARVQVNVWGTTRREVALLSRQVENALRSAYALQPSIESAATAVWEPDTRMRGSHQDFSFMHDL